MLPNEYIRPVQLPGLTIPCNLFLAPLAGFTDYAFRAVCIEKSACFTYTEMVSAEGLIRDGKKTLDLLTRAPGEKMYGIQLFAARPEAAEEAARRCRVHKPSLIDLNCGCPVPKVIKNGAGAALLKTPEKLYALVRALRKGAENVPVSVKIRSGWDANSINFLETAAAAADGGASMICLHPRTRSQGYGGRADWEQIGELKARSPLPVIGSGDLFTPEAAVKMFLETACDAVIFARGAIGNPFIFRQTKELLLGAVTPGPVPIEERLNTAWKQYSLLIEKKGEISASKEIKKHFAAYTKGLPRAGELRNALMHAGDAESFRKIFHNYMEENIKIM